jgi:signal transduction histidine kinase
MPAKNLFFVLHKQFIFLLLLLVAACHSLLAQRSVQESIHQLMESSKQQNTDKASYIDRRNEIAVQFKETKTDSVILLLNETILLCREEKYRKGEVDATRILGNAYETKRLFNDALITYDKAYALAKNADYPSAEARILNNQGSVHLYMGSYPNALEKFYASLKIAENIQDKETLGIVLNNMANLFYFQNKMKDAESYYIKTLALTKEINDSVGLVYAYNNLGELYLKTRDYKKASEHLLLAAGMARQSGILEIELASGTALGQLYGELDSIELAGKYYEAVIQKANEFNDPLNHAKGLLGLAALKHKLGMENEALNLANLGIEYAVKIGQNQLCRDGHELLASIYEKMGNGMEALSHFRSFKLYADSLNNLESERAAATYEAEYAYSKKELQFQRQAFQQRWIIFSAFAGVLLLGIIAIYINRNRNRLNKINHALVDKNLEIENKKVELENTVYQLTATQAQLIHAEKMASLGELTSGIAHEIQNPLNFVKNFSEVSIDLLGELKVELQKPVDEEVKEEQNAILLDVTQNLERILLHSNRADGIVKSMLYHSRTGSGKKEPAIINTLCLEFLKLSYHGMRAKESVDGKQLSFNSHYETDFSPEVGSVKVIPQDLGRVFLNLFNNAFYATSERYSKGEKDYEPMVKVITRREMNGVMIVVEDNGPGIPDKIREKIFQPFFTTKPTGSGTGLGLSISYDIITKGHGGKLEVDSEPGKYTRFTLYIPDA